MTHLIIGMLQPKFISIEGLFPDLFKIIPGWIKGVIHAITAGTGVGKTRFVKYAFLLHSYNFCKANNIPFFCIWFALEESAENFWISIAQDLLQERYGLELTYYQYVGMHSGFTDEHRRALEELQPELELMKKSILVYDHVSNPTGMYNTIKRFMASIGTRTDGILEEDEFGNKYISFDYVYNNPETQVMVVTDHMSLINPEKSAFGNVSTTHAAMAKFSEYCVKFIAKKYQCIVVSIHQQISDGDSTENMKMGRAEPTLDKLGVNKIIQQEYEVVFGIFNPAGVTPPITNHAGYNVTRFGDHFRTIRLLKHRKGKPDRIKAVYFHGVTNKYEELPLPFIEGTKTPNPELEQFYNRS